MAEIPKDAHQWQDSSVDGNDEDDQEADDEDEDFSICMNPPAAPIKSRARRRFWWRGVVVSQQQQQQHQQGKILLKKSPIEDFYRVDTVNAVALTSGKYSSSSRKPPKQVKVLLPGVPRYEDDWARDSHDYFNLIVLVPVMVLNVMNWNWEKILSSSRSNHNNKASDAASSFSHKLQSAWTGDWFDAFLIATVAYFMLDLLWIQMIPSCVKSPGIIRLHHVAVIIFLWLPYQHTPVRYCMGACMAVELNTWFLIARRVFNKQGFPPWTVLEVSRFWSIRIKVISVAFYVTWIGIRCVLYPALLWPFYRHWRELSRLTGSYWNVLCPSVPLHAAFCLLNIKWTHELIMSKVRYHRRQRRLVRSPHNNSDNSNLCHQDSVDKGL